MTKVTDTVVEKLCFRMATCTSDSIAKDWDTVEDFTCLKTVLATTVNGDKALNMAKERFGILTERDTRVRNDE